MWVLQRDGQQQAAAGEVQAPVRGGGQPLLLLRSIHPICPSHTAPHLQRGAVHAGRQARVLCVAALGAPPLVLVGCRRKLAGGGARHSGARVRLLRGHRSGVALGAALRGVRRGRSVVRCRQARGAAAQGAPPPASPSQPSPQPRLQPSSHPPWRVSRSHPRPVGCPAATAASGWP